MYSFICDYSEGAHPNIIEAMVRTNMEQCEGYSEDVHCLHAAELIKKKIQCEEVDIHFLPGGTPTNVIALSAFLKRFEAVICPSTGHIHVHETGALESFGHKILTADSKDGKITPPQIQHILDDFEDEHTVRRKIVFITNPTEIGAVYTKAELTALRSICDANDMYLYIDGARLGCALTAKGNDVDLSDLPKLADAFYIGGTKNGALLGEALVIRNDKLKEDFRFYIKQGCALLAKGKIMGIQFEELFKDDLYFELAAHANEMAAMLSAQFKDMGFSFLTESLTNQIFPILPTALIEKLEREYKFYVWAKVDEGHSAIRLVTSWATEKERVLKFIEDLKAWA